MATSDPVKELAVKNAKYIKNCIELYMSNRQIRFIGNFERFVNLEVLWINNNEIERLENLQTCVRIKQLYAQNNRIHYLDSTITKFKFLQDLRLSNNKIHDLHGTLQLLCKFQYLKHLDLFANPLAEESKYRLHVINAIPSLVALDNHVITDVERNAAKRLKTQRNSAARESNETKTKAKTVCGAPPTELSGTVKLLIKEVKRIEKEAKIKDEAEKKALFELDVDKLVPSNSTPLQSFRGSMKEKLSNGLEDWEYYHLKKYIKQHEVDGFLTKESLGSVLEEMTDHGKELDIQLDEPQSDSSTEDSTAFLFEILRKGDEERFPANSFLAACQECIKGEDGESLGTIHWVSLPGEILMERAEILSEEAMKKERRAMSLPDSDERKANIIKEAHSVSQKACRLEALAALRPSSKGSTQKAERSSLLCADQHISSSNPVPIRRDVITTYSCRQEDGIAELSVPDTVPKAMAKKYRLKGKEYEGYLQEKKSRLPVYVKRETFVL